MIILDTCILRGMSLDDSSADFLRTIRAVGVHGVAVPWMVMEELAAQHAVKYREKHAAAAAAIESVAQLTPWGLKARLDPCDLERIRDHWRKAYREIAETIPVSEGAMREAMFREANALPPCKASKGAKTGARDASIWLSAVEYAREHPEETVFFVSSNTKDFTDGSSYAFPMDEDVADLGDRFVHVTSLDEVVSRLTEPAETDDVSVEAALNSPSSYDVISEAALRLGAADGTQRAIRCTTGAWPFDGTQTDLASLWLTKPVINLSSYRDVASYRIGDHEWCTATTRWVVGAVAQVAGSERIAPVACAWETRVLLTPGGDEPRLTILRSAEPEPLSVNDLTALPDLQTEYSSLVGALAVLEDDAIKNVRERVQGGEITTLEAVLLAATLFWGPYGAKRRSRAGG
ncbi:PIN domain-containing protein [Streptomyces ureilyticus]|uniref:DUF4935 domain-containing protein n=1 Tax=Streptomyces ureilyticus TaxID=1775131 RepID=A0ABX0DYQ5_9ACTN|nr:PIN domain-containing protein [Streptomyces ureilyticus]NGO45109.1 DUF4935 domain-containing protein [Streptomyces ureilyticus]